MSPREGETPMGVGAFKMKQDGRSIVIMGRTPLPCPRIRAGDRRRIDRATQLYASPNAVRTVVCLALLVLLGASTATNAANASPAADIVAFKTEQPFALDGIPTETFWGQVPATYLPLTGTTPYGGNVPQMWAKAAHNGTYIFLLLQWADTKESRVVSSGKRLVLSTPGNLTGRFHYNASYYYTDAGTVTWWMGAEKPSVLPATGDQMGGSPPRRASLFGWAAGDKAELWQWEAAVLDLGNPYWPYSGVDPGVSKWDWGDASGKPYTMPYSSAFQNLYNSTGTWTLGDGLLHSKGCQQPGTEPFEVRARGVWSNGIWSLELARPFVSSPKNRPYTLPLKEDKTYWVVFAAFDGNKGEVDEVASISKWVSLEISKEFFPLEKRIQEASKTAGEALEAATNAQTASKDALSSAQAAVTAAYAAIGLAAVAMAVAVVLGLRRRKP